MWECGPSCREYHDITSHEQRFETAAAPSGAAALKCHEFRHIQRC